MSTVGRRGLIFETMSGLARSRGTPAAVRARYWRRKVSVAINQSPGCTWPGRTADWCKDHYTIRRLTAGLAWSAEQAVGQTERERRQRHGGIGTRGGREDRARKHVQVL